MTRRKPDRPLRIELVAMNDRSQRTFEMMFSRIGRDHGLVVDGSVAELALVDMDSVGSNRLLTEYQSRLPERPLVLLSVSGETPDPALPCLRKPVNIDALLDLLAAMQQRLDRSVDPDAATRSPTTVEGTRTIIRADGEPLIVRTASTTARTGLSVRSTDSEPRTQPLVAGVTEHAEARTVPLVDTDHAAGAPDPRHTAPATPAIAGLVGDRPDIDCDDPIAVAGIQLETGNFLLDHVLQALDEAPEGYALVLALPGGDLVLDGRGRRVLQPGGTLDLQGLCDQPLAEPGPRRSQVSTRVIDDILMDDRSTVAALDSEALVWQLALWTYRGRLPAGTSLRERAYLSHWPDLTRLTEIPHAMQIASLWSVQPMTLRDIAAALKIPQRHVFAFYGAARAIGLAGQARREADLTFQPSAAQRHEKHGLLSSMVGKLRSLIFQSERV